MGRSLAIIAVAFGAIVAGFVRGGTDIFAFFRISRRHASWTDTFCKVEGLGKEETLNHVVWRSVALCLRFSFVAPFSDCICLPPYTSCALDFGTEMLRTSNSWWPTRSELEAANTVRCANQVSEKAQLPTRFTLSSLGEDSVMLAW